MYHSTLGLRVREEEGRNLAVALGVVVLAGGESERARERGERETSGYEPFALHAAIHWAIKGDVIKNRG